MHTKVVTAGCYDNCAHPFSVHSTSVLVLPWWGVSHFVRGSNPRPPCPRGQPFCVGFQSPTLPCLTKWWTPRTGEGRGLYPAQNCWPPAWGVGHFVQDIIPHPPLCEGSTILCGGQVPDPPLSEVVSHFVWWSNPRPSPLHLLVLLFVYPASFCSYSRICGVPPPKQNFTDLTKQELLQAGIPPFLLNN